MTLRHSARFLFFARLGRTKLGAEVFSKTRSEMRHIERSESRFVRFLTRRRPIDFLAIEVDGPITKELHPSFRYVKHACTLLIMGPLFFLLVTGELSPSYYVLVPTGFVTAEQFNRMWDFSHWGVVLLGQLFIFLVFYDLSVYGRYPFFAYVLAPAFRRLGLRRPVPQSATLSIDELRRRPHAKPLGVPLSEMRKASQRVECCDPFGARRQDK